MKTAGWGVAAFLAGVLVAVLALPSNEPLEALDFGFGAHERPSSPAGWEPGDAWRVSFPGGDPVCWLVLVDADEASFQQGVWCPTDEAESIAAQIAAFDVAWLGRFTLELGGVEESGNVVRFFDWPLEAGKSWTTPWGEDEVEITTSHDPVLDRFVFKTNAGVTYDFDPRLGWWSFFEHEGELLLEVVERERRWEGEAVYATAEDRLVRSRGTAGLAFPAGGFLAEEQDALLVVELASSGPVAGYFDLRDPSGRSVYRQDYAVETARSWTVLDSIPGSWTVIDAVAGGRFETLVRAVLLETVTIGRT